MKKKHILTLVYAICGSLCLAACLWAAKASLWAHSMTSTSFDISYMWLELAPMAVLGIVWGGEHCLAKLADKKVVAAVRILQIVMLVLWSLDWLWGCLPKGLSMWDLSAFGYVIAWLLLGLQLFSTVELLVKKPKTT